MSSKSLENSKALHLAARNNDVSQVESLSLKVDVDARDDFHWTPLHDAADKNQEDSHFEVIELLLKHGADVNARSNIGTTALHFMVYHAGVNTVQLLLNYGADVSLKNSNGESCLHPAIRGGKIEVVKLLLEHGADVNNVGGEGLTPLHWACIGDYKADIIKYLLENNAKVDAFSFQGYTPLTFLLDNNIKTKNFRKLLASFLNYADVNIVDTQGKNVLQLCKGEDNWKILLRHLAKLQALDLTIHPSILDTISSTYKYTEFFKICTKELNVAKSSKLRDSWLTYLNLLVDSKKKLKNYAGNRDMIRAFNNSKCMKKFPIYGAEIQKNVDKGVKRRNLFDESSIIMSDNLPIFNPNHLIIRDILDCLNMKDYVTFTSEI